MLSLHVSVNPQGEILSRVNCPRGHTISGAKKYEARCGAARQWENFCQTPGLSPTEMMSVTRCHLNAHIARICENKMHECEICCVNSLVDRDANHSKSTLQTRGSSVRRARFSPYTKYVLKWCRSDCLRKVWE